MRKIRSSISADELYGWMRVGRTRSADADGPFRAGLRTTIQELLRRIFGAVITQRGRESSALEQRVRFLERNITARGIKLRGFCAVGGCGKSIQELLRRIFVAVIWKMRRRRSGEAGADGFRNGRVARNGENDRKMRVYAMRRRCCRHCCDCYHRP